MTAPTRTPLEILGELEAIIVGLVKLIATVFPQFTDGQTAGGLVYSEAVECASKLPALRAALEAQECPIYDPAHDCEDYCAMCRGLENRRAAPRGGKGEE